MNGDPKQIFHIFKPVNGDKWTTLNTSDYDFWDDPGMAPLSDLCDETPPSEWRLGGVRADTVYVIEDTEGCTLFHIGTSAPERYVLKWLIKLGGLDNRNGYEGIGDHVLALFKQDTAMTAKQIRNSLGVTTIKNTLKYLLNNNLLRRVARLATKGDNSAYVYYLPDDEPQFQGGAAEALDAVTVALESCKRIRSELDRARAELKEAQGTIDRLHTILFNQVRAIK